MKKPQTIEVQKQELPREEVKNEIEVAISKSKIKVKKNYIYDTDPTKLTEQIEQITRYQIRKQNLQDEITRLEKSDESNKELLIERLKYFEKDNEIYISIIKQYLGIKDRTFNFILEDLISKLNLTEDLIDASFSFYISSTDKTNKEIIEINEAYDDLIHADYK